MACFPWSSPSGPAEWSNLLHCREFSLPLSRIAVIVCEISAMLKGLGEASVSPFACRSFSANYNQSPLGILPVRFSNPEPRFTVSEISIFKGGETFFIRCLLRSYFLCVYCMFTLGCREVSQGFFYSYHKFFHKKSGKNLIISKFVVIFASTKTNIQNFLIQAQ